MGGGRGGGGGAPLPLPMLALHPNHGPDPSVCKANDTDHPVGTIDGQMGVLDGIVEEG